MVQSNYWTHRLAGFQPMSMMPQRYSPWLRTFIGRIVDLKCSSQYVLDMFQEDLARMDALYGGGNDVIQ